MGSRETFTIGAERADGDGTAVVVVCGEIDLAAQEPLLAAVGRVRSPGCRLVVDLSDVSFIDSSGLLALLRASEAQRADGGTFVLRRPSAEVRRLLDMTGVSAAVEIDGPAGDGRASDGPAADGSAADGSAADGSTADGSAGRVDGDGSSPVAGVGGSFAGADGDGSAGSDVEGR